MSKRFFTSDTHFGHDRILSREDRPFKNMDEFESYIIDLWNSQTQKGDVIYFVGDFVEHTTNNKNWDACFDILKKLVADVILILGNNEDRIIKEYFGGDFEKFRKHCISRGFVDVRKDDTIMLGDKQVYIVHEPTKHKEGMLNLFGHTHRSTGLCKPYGINVDCDLSHFRLLSEDDILKLFNCKEKFWDNDPDNLCMGTGVVTLENYRDYFLAENIKNYNMIGFYPREFYCLDNFSSFAVCFKGVKYSTVEHAYQALKFEETAPEISKEIAESYSADEAKRIAARNINRQNPNWNKIKLEVMENLLRAKIEQNPYVKKKLLETKDYLICEDSPKDDFWGIGADRKGQNNLGKLWMKIRDEFSGKKI